VVTNNHVVEGAEDIKVTLTDGRTFRGTLVGTDRFSDLAVVKIEGANLPTIVLGDSASLVVGEPVIAIGNPLWLEGGPTVTVGVVSALGRSMEDPGLPVLHNLIQTDAAINPGNSGGALVNLDGQVIGINTALVASAHGIGFAIASNTARPVLQALIKDGRIVRPSLGIDAVTVTPQVAYANDLGIDEGALVTHVAADGPAARAGVMEGDVISAVRGRRVRGVHELHAALAGQRIGDTVTIAVSRRGAAITINAALEEYR
jgi:serine protease Do